MKYDIRKHVLHFHQPAGTSRGIYTTRTVWYVTLHEGKRTGVGECAPLPKLSCDELPNYEDLLQRCCQKLIADGVLDTQALLPYPSIRFALECALAQLKESEQTDNTFLSGDTGIPINGLVWMGTYDEMLQRVDEKLAAGFHCIKLKIGAIGFDDELRLLERVRRQFDRSQVELRVDANGAFTPNEAPERLRQLAAYDLHSIEQPIRAGQHEALAALCQQSELPIALDEELIGVNDTAAKIQLLDKVRPHYIVLKPSLHGGLSGCDEWIRLAEERGIGWWATSALESNIGLAAIARWCASYHPTLPQGLGTGLLYTNNTPPQTIVRGDHLYILS